MHHVTVTRLQQHPTTMSRERPVVITGLSDRPAMIAQGKWDRGGSRRMMEKSFLSPMERSIILTEEGERNECCFGLFPRAYPSAHFTFLESPPRRPAGTMRNAEHRSAPRTALSAECVQPNTVWMQEAFVKTCKDGNRVTHMGRYDRSLLPFCTGSDVSEEEELPEWPAVDHEHMWTACNIVTVNLGYPANEGEAERKFTPLSRERERLHSGAVTPVPRNQNPAASHCAPPSPHGNSITLSPPSGPLGALCLWPHESPAETSPSVIKTPSSDWIKD
ncbi:hypothetical protein EYF80_026225 [Liparis tanakae]|uniref:Uncharacterized protein n=1 Tax=Liparis tanakae TaxID=230148 RepID=A0A4Z2HF11_9TELE|nr:hypothetical protein EYF80_026225 [Liparis tanakae]